MSSGILIDNNGKAILFNGKAVFVTDYLKFTADNANIVERCTYTTLSNGITVSATSSYGRASFYFPVTSGKRYKLTFNSVCVDGYKMLYISNKTYASGEGWSGTYTTMSLATDGNKSYTFTANSNILWLGLYASANTSTGTITITNAELNEV
jgi:hypothetical protein